MSNFAHSLPKHAVKTEAGGFQSGSSIAKQHQLWSRNLKQRQRGLGKTGRVRTMTAQLTRLQIAVFGSLITVLCITAVVSALMMFTS